MKINTVYVVPPALILAGFDYSKLPRMWVISVDTGRSYHCYSQATKPTAKQIRGYIKQTKNSKLYRETTPEFVKENGIPAGVSVGLVTHDGQFNND